MAKRKAKRKRVELSELTACFETLEDPRSSINRRHPLPSVMMISLMAVLAGADGPTAIHQWANAKEDWLPEVLPLPYGIPSKDVFRRVLMALQPEAFQVCFVEWLKVLRGKSSDDEAARDILAFDGKTLRGSRDRSNGLGPLHLVSVWLTEAGLTLGQVAAEEKSNEITAIPELLKLVDVNGAIITIDAMGTQKAIAKAIVDGGGDYVLALKRNQSGLHDAVIKYVDAHLEDNFAGLKARQHVDENKGHGRQERRSYIQFPVPADLQGKDKWKGIRTIGIAISETTRGGEETQQIRYFISSLRMGVKQFSRAVRQHWSIENTCHWSLDVSYREDAQRTRDRYLAENLAWLRRYTLSLLKQHTGKQSLVMKRRKCGWNDDFMLEVLMQAST